TVHLLTLFLAWWYSCMLIFGETIIHFHHAVQKSLLKDQHALVIQIYKNIKIKTINPNTRIPAG
ncbi:hypothetical protein, partial [Psychromonas sp. SP041]|uniref:hypothetical protein n=1 Tax=Psychromonas sp. SP041 TaxID=1365007 RepID=UPI00197EB58D